MKYVFLIGILLAGCNCSSSPPIDPQSAIEGNDLTAIVSGCGQQVGSGYIVCRMTEGQLTSGEFLEIHSPPHVKCDHEDACLYFTIFYPDGRPTYEGKVPKGESFTKVPFQQIVDKPTFELTDRGIYGISIKLHFTVDGTEHTTYSDGILFIRVVKKDYVPLSEAEEDDNFAWRWRQGNQTIKMTTGFRVFISPPPKGI